MSGNGLEGDPESIQAFAAAVRMFGEAIEAAAAALHSGLNSAREGWPDSNGDAAEAQVEELLGSMNPTSVAESASSIASEADALAARYAELLGG